jgi:hypothetical protein
MAGAILRCCAMAALLFARADAQGKACTLAPDCQLTCADGLPLEFGEHLDLSGFSGHHNAEGYYMAIDTEPGDTCVPPVPAAESP